MDRSKLPTRPDRLKNDLVAAEYSSIPSEGAGPPAAVVTPTQSNDTDDAGVLAAAVRSELRNDHLAFPLLLTNDAEAAVNLPPRIGNADTNLYRDSLSATFEDDIFGDWDFSFVLRAEDDLASLDSLVGTKQRPETAPVEDIIATDPAGGNVATQQQLVYTEVDVLFGRGESTNQHPGNILFRGGKVRFQQRYLQATTRKMKTAIAQELVDFMFREYGSRFLAYDKATMQWDVVDNKRVLEKSKQLLREDFTPEERKQKRLLYAEKKKRAKQL